MTKNTYTIYLEGYGGEAVMGRVTKDTYDYFNKNNIDLSEFCNNSEYPIEIPENLMPFRAGEWHECDSIAHCYGVEMHDACRIRVEDSRGKTIWESDLNPKNISKKIGKVDNSETYSVDDELNGTVVFFGQSVEKGGFFDAEVQTEKFNPKKLTLKTRNLNGWTIVDSVKYAEEELYNNSSSGTTGKDSFYEFVISESSKKPKSPHKIPSENLTNWFNSSVNPVHKGNYEIKISNGMVETYLAYWNGEVFSLIHKTNKFGKRTTSELSKNQILMWRGCKK